MNFTPCSFDMHPIHLKFVCMNVDQTFQLCFMKYYIHIRVIKLFSLIYYVSIHVYTSKVLPLDLINMHTCLVLQTLQHVIITCSIHFV